MYPIDCLNSLDRATIEDYIKEYCHIEVNDLDGVLTSWNKNKTKLFKMFGHKLRLTKQVDLEMDEDLVYRSLRQVYPRFSTQLLDIYTENYGCRFTLRLANYLLTNDLYVNTTTKTSMQKLFSYRPMAEGHCHENLYFEFEGECLPHTSFRITSGTKVMKAIRKVCEATRFFKYVKEGQKLFEEFRNKISDVCTRKSIHGTLVMSIHPIDYLTLSHNNSGWSSCLSWDGGMYAGGTLEALNSNMCVVCYLLNESKSFTTIQNKYPIPNKAWRCMFFVHKNIILSGNPYPFDNKQLVLEGLDWAYELAYNNMHWDYKYKKQEYKDMLHRTNNEYTRHNVCELTCCSKNIIVYTYGLYNDFCYPENTFYCYRNPVYKLLRLSLGGRGTCLMCGKKLENINKDYFLQSDEDYETRQHYRDYMCEECDHNAYLRRTGDIVYAKNSHSF